MPSSGLPSSMQTRTPDYTREDGLQMRPSSCMLVCGRRCLRSWITDHALMEPRYDLHPHPRRLDYEG
ncbi:hypothetical protein PSTG_11104 [Puccinia striiformis f. sp. tritici PST-78]|uniref:Uncharacterized protein n=1 Tax=Puccinia striiformis f. sp. tritici PST-78 TaxID=1165861 RepID=A0A0L0V9F4_9BASI|nr:hypothetical protein PSTG_11104 [Puccinia striiformis f. sp. tritici PST-78]